MFKKFIAVVTAAIIFITIIAPDRVRASDDINITYYKCTYNILLNPNYNQDLYLTALDMVRPYINDNYIALSSNRNRTTELSGTNIYFIDMSRMYYCSSYTTSDKTYHIYSNRPSRDSEPTYFPYHFRSTDNINLTDLSSSDAPYSFYVRLPAFLPTSISDVAFHGFDNSFLNGISGYLDSWSDERITTHTRTGCDFYANNFDQMSIVPSSNNGVLTNNLQIDKYNFAEWIINNNKLPYIYEQSGFEIPSSKLSVLVDYYDQYGGSLINFLLYWPVWSVKYSISVGDALSQKNLFTCLRTLYKQYLNYKNSPTYDTVYGPHLPDFIKPNTNNDDQTLITDQDDDTADISILREILRAVLNIPQYINNSTEQINNRFDELIYNINLLPDNISNYIHASFMTDINKIISALDNVGGTNNIDIDIPDDKETEVKVFFDDWSLKFDNKINEKIPVVSQLSGIFSADFFEKCGIDVNEDGAVYQYYNSELSVQLMDLPAPSIGNSLASSSAEHKAVKSLLLQFDDSDPDYLNDAAFTEDVPDWSVSIGGNNVEIFSFKFYAKYRTQIHTIVTFILYIGYFFRLYKSIPTIIGNVADVEKAFENYNTDNNRGDL